MKWALLLLCGCNRLLGIGTSTHIDTDAQFFDGLADAPFACPMLGSSTPPPFVNVFQQVDTLASCELYSPASNGTAVALCGGVLAQGPVDGPLVALPPSASEINVVRGLRLSPEADLLIVEGTSQGGIALDVEPETILSVPLVEVDTFDPMAQTWSVIGEQGPFLATAPTPLVNGKRHLITIDQTGLITELVGDGLSWTAVQSFDQTTIGIMGSGAPSLGMDNTSNPDPAMTTDGLRLLVPGTDAMGKNVIYYTDRTTINGTFGMAKTLEVPGDLSEMYMTDDCSRLYFSALETVFYISQ